MSDFRNVRGFEEAWRPLGARRRPEAVLRAAASGADVQARLARIVRRAPEVMVKASGRTRGSGHTRSTGPERRRSAAARSLAALDESGAMVALSGFWLRGGNDPAGRRFGVKGARLSARVAARWPPPCLSGRRLRPARRRCVGVCVCRRYPLRSM